VLEFVDRRTSEGFGETEEDLLLEVIGSLGSAASDPGAVNLLARALLRAPLADPIESVNRSLSPPGRGRPEAEHPLLSALIEGLAASDPKTVRAALAAEIALAEHTGNLSLVGKDYLLDAFALLCSFGGEESESRAIVLEVLAGLCLRLSPRDGHAADGVACLLLARTKTSDAGADADGRRLEEAAALFDRANRPLARHPPRPNTLRRFLPDADAEAGIHPRQSLAAAGPLCRAMAAARRGEAEKSRELAGVAASRAPDDAATLEMARRILRKTQ
jgi:hypothetical protein